MNQKHSAKMLMAGWILTVSISVPAWARFEPITCKNGFTPDQEIAEGNKAALQVYQTMPVLPENDPVTRYVQALGAKLVQDAPLVPGVTRQWPFTFHVVASQDINAFALPGGSIFVNLGTVQAADTEAQLAGVMAHETSHVVMRHSTCNLTRQQKRSLFYGLGAIGSAVLLGNGAAGQLAQTGLGMGQSLDFLHMSRQDEQQADLLGTGILYDAGYDPRGLPQFFEVISAKYGSGGAQFLSDHPNPGNRTEYVDQEIATLPRRTNPLVNTPAFKQMHAVAMQRTALSAKDIQGGAWRQTGQYAARPGSNGAVVTAVSTSGGVSQGQPSSAETSSAGSMAPLSRAQLGLSARLVPLDTQQFSLRYPASWKQSTDGNGTVTIAPEGGAGSAGLAYGALIGLVKGNGNNNAEASLADTTRALVTKFTGQGSGLTQTAQISSLQVGGQAANSVELRGTSPVLTNGKTQSEHDWLVTLSRADGDVNYLVFVAPENDFSTLKPVFNSMLNSFHPQ